MSEICQDLANIWFRQFDHKQFISGEIKFIVQEFEEKRSDTDVDHLFQSIENQTDIRDTEIAKFEQAVEKTVSEANTELQQALNIANRFADIENQFIERANSSKALQEREDKWKSFMSKVTASYSKINASIEEQQEELTLLYGSEAARD